MILKIPPNPPFSKGGARCYLTILFRARSLMMSARNNRRILKFLIVFLGLVPALLLVRATLNDQLGANPIQTLHFRLGDWALRFLLIGLALTPIKIITKQASPLRYRRMMGLLAFFYASLHGLVYVALDLSWSWTAFIDEVPKSPYIVLGLLTYLLLVPLAITSTKYFKKRLGRRWFSLHKLVYVAALTACLHYLWLVKLDVSQPLLYIGLLGILVSIRIVKFYRNRGA